MDNPNPRLTFENYDFCDSNRKHGGNQDPHPGNHKVNHSPSTAFSPTIWIRFSDDKVRSAFRQGQFFPSQTGSIRELPGLHFFLSAEKNPPTNENDWILLPEGFTRPACQRASYSTGFSSVDTIGVPRSAFSRFAGGVSIQIDELSD